MTTAEIYTVEGPDGVTYRITSVDSATTRGSFGIPTELEREWTVEAVDQRGNYFAAAFVFFQFISSRHATDPWGNPVAENGIELTEEAESLSRVFRGRVRWSFPTATAGAGSESSDSSGGGGDGGDSGAGGPFSYVPFISSFSTAGGTRHVDVSYGTRAYAINGSAPNFGGGIGWNGEGFDGVDIVSPSIVFDVTARTPVGFVANFATFLNKVVPFIGCVNSESFYGCAPGTVLFNGITSSSLKSRTTNSGATDYYWEMTYSFAAQPNVVLNVQGVAVPKGGWEYVWALGSEESVQAIYVEQVYQTANLSQLGFG